MYDLLPLRATPERSEIISDLLRKVAVTPTLFSDRKCLQRCIASEKTLPEMCTACVQRMQTVTEVLGRLDTKAWEVWNDEALVGIIFFTHVTSLDATGHYVFFDHDLASKTEVIQEAMQRMLEVASRLTVEIPASFPALAKHAHKRLGFGGDFYYDFERERDGRKKTERIHVEGVKRKAALRDGKLVDLLILGFSGDTRHTS